MKVTIFSSNQPRHLYLAKSFANISDEVFFVSEVNTVFPGKIEDFFKKSKIMQSYFEKVMASEKKIFGEGAKNKPGFPEQPDWFKDARGFKNLEIGLKKI